MPKVEAEVEDTKVEEAVAEEEVKAVEDQVLVLKPEGATTVERLDISKQLAENLQEKE